ncbi:MULTISPECIES: hypothetical protein [unclassified Mesorhizobium]|uniref:hypothetical protein n=1 Tax=unclassified Mesorhizobium TaxID=325217 RepID=UPI00112849B4|nr:MULTISPECIES: hypothetical protein [unclassified Mesorhizobium]TPK42634.1 hypothetical protein FJ550_29710 [Mesorhizobium sp. B2-5-2]TPL26754.1 hypothetical protein FJ946_13030 [Mesorhizobium sp. B2-4-7]TPL40532.1 hypothetical protein FJ961_17330 [Mesorhizobium sp. B2-4-5]TPM76806.1 hypothetical protein FJ968_03560 [Mesorhizobium sp. B2-1-6]TPN72469.1 hypothetical protein FJ985_29215 [Mesorhizobium sp. B1-1-2]
MSTDLRRRIAMLERLRPVISAEHDGHAVAGFTGFIAETLDRGTGSYADQAALLFGLPSASQFLKWCAARFTDEAHSRLARDAYGDDWREKVDEVAEVAAARCRAVHGDAWEQVLADRMASDKRDYQYEPARAI